MSEVLVPPLVSFTIAIALLFVGKAIIERSELLKNTLYLSL